MDIFDYIIRGFFAVVLITVIWNLAVAIYSEGIRPKKLKNKNRKAQP